MNEKEAFPWQVLVYEKQNIVIVISIRMKCKKAAGAYNLKISVNSTLITSLS